MPGKDHPRAGFRGHFAARLRGWRGFVVVLLILSLLNPGTSYAASKVRVNTRQLRIANLLPRIGAASHGAKAQRSVARASLLIIPATKLRLAQPEPLRFRPAKPLYSQEYRNLVSRFALYSTLAGAVLGAGAIIVAQSDPQASWAGNSGFKDARNRGAMTMGIPATIFLGAGITAWIWLWVQGRRQHRAMAQRAGYRF